LGFVWLGFVFGAFRLSTEFLVMVQKLKDQLYARRRGKFTHRTDLGVLDAKTLVYEALNGGVGNQDDVLALLQAIRHRRISN